MRKSRPTGRFIGERVMATITRVMSAGVVATIERGDTIRLEARILGFPDWDHAARWIKDGDRIELRIEAVASNGRILRVALADPEAHPRLIFARQHHVGEEVVARVATDLPHAMLVTLAPGVDGYLRHRDVAVDAATVAAFKRSHPVGEILRVQIADICDNHQGIRVTLTDTALRRYRRAGSGLAEGSTGRLCLAR